MSFYRDENGQALLLDRGFAREWADRAGKLALNELEMVHEDNIVTFASLSLFWYTQGSWRRSYIHKGMETTGKGKILRILMSSRDVPCRECNANCSYPRPCRRRKSQRQLLDRRGLATTLLGMLPHQLPQHGINVRHQYAAKDCSASAPLARR